MAIEPTFFATAGAFRTWLKRNSASANELLVGFYKRESGQPSMTWPESVDEALCVRWVDGVRKRIDASSYQIRFTPRKQGSTWSAVNIAKVKVLTESGRMRASGLKAFAARSATKSRTYSYEQSATAALAPKDEALFRKNKAAWPFFAAQAPSYRKKLLWWVIGAKQDVTRAKRLVMLIKASASAKRM
jgi:uncharacterized protein YdeI (YjbR/CyaY-like superfamily)